MYSPTFIYLKKHIDDIGIKNVDDFIERRVFVLGIGDGEKHKLAILLELVFHKPSTSSGGPGEVLPFRGKMH